MIMRDIILSLYVCVQKMKMVSFLELHQEFVRQFAHSELSRLKWDVLKNKDSIWLHLEDATILTTSKNMNDTMMNINIFLVKRTKGSLSFNFPTFFSFVLKAILNLSSEQIPKTLNYESSLIISKIFT